VIFGPNYKKYREAVELIEEGGAFSIANSKELEYIMEKLLKDPDYLKESGLCAKRYLEENTGATEKVISYIQANRLLTS
jgi:3-deoxy-D-manno-octulosonic-acid transferase